MFLFVKILVPVWIVLMVFVLIRTRRKMMSDMLTKIQKPELQQTAATEAEE